MSSQQLPCHIEHQLLRETLAALELKNGLGKTTNKHSGFACIAF